MEEDKTPAVAIPTGFPSCQIMFEMDSNFHCTLPSEYEYGSHSAIIVECSSFSGQVFQKNFWKDGNKASTNYATILIIEMNYYNWWQVQYICYSNIIFGNQNN